MLRPLTIAQRINAERLMILAWPRAILMQLAHPLVAAGVADHSTFRAGPVTAARRLHHTIRAMLSLVFGDEVAQSRTIAAIRAIHRRVNGQLRTSVGPYPAGTRYSAEDPALLLWVHITLLDSIVLAHDLFIRPLSDAERDEYVAQAAGVAIALGARDDEVPRTWASLTQTMNAAIRSGQIAVGPDARELERAITRLPWPILTFPFAHGLRLLTYGQMPADVRAQYGYRWQRRDDRRCANLVLLVKSTRFITPRVFAWWPEAR
jgi:uncharacterized protein (DUF2236 family)